MGIRNNGKVLVRFLPVSLNINKKHILIIGGGKTALQKLRMVRRFVRRITVCAAEICPEIAASGATLLRQSYTPKILRGYFLVYACTNDRVLNARIKKDAAKHGALVNVVDDPANCDFISPAVYKKRNMTVAVSSDGSNVKKSVAWRNKIRELLKDD
jgi:precorrin-2 dehydrogenase/sirohydrochlorin ferrochelatase